MGEGSIIASRAKSLLRSGKYTIKQATDMSTKSYESQMKNIDKKDMPNQGEKTWNKK